MTIAWDSEAARDCWDGVRKDFGEALDRIEEAIGRGKEPCALSPSGEHDWTRRPSAIVPGRGWDECRACKAERWG